MSIEKMLLADVSVLSQLSDTQLQEYYVMCPYSLLYEMRALNTHEILNILQYAYLAVPDIKSDIDYNHYRPTPLLYCELSGNKQFSILSHSQSMSLFNSIDRDYAKKCLANIYSKHVSNKKYAERDILTGNSYKNLLKVFVSNIMTDEKLLFEFVNECYQNNFQCAPPIINKSVKNLMLYIQYMTIRMLNDYVLSESIELFVLNDFSYATEMMDDRDDIDDSLKTRIYGVQNIFKEILGRFSLEHMPSLLTFYVLYLINLENCIREHTDIDGMSDTQQVCKDIRHLYYLPLCDIFVPGNDVQRVIVDNLPMVFTEYKEKMDG